VSRRVSAVLAGTVGLAWSALLVSGLASGGPAFFLAYVAAGLLATAVGLAVLARRFVTHEPGLWTPVLTGIVGSLLGVAAPVLLLVPAVARALRRPFAPRLDWLEPEDGGGVATAFGGLYVLVVVVYLLVGFHHLGAAVVLVAAGVAGGLARPVAAVGRALVRRVRD
jgi:hypothetical protein